MFKVKKNKKLLRHLIDKFPLLALLVGLYLEELRFKKSNLNNKIFDMDIVNTFK